MVKQHQKRPPVFASADESIDDIIGAPTPHHTPEQEHEATGSELPLPESEHVEEIDQETSLPELETKSSAEPEERVPSDDVGNVWREITSAQQTGKTFFVTSDLEAEGVRALWRRTRVLDHNRWVSRGKWSDALTRTDVLPQPIYYREVF